MQVFSPPLAPRDCVMLFAVIQPVVYLLKNLRCYFFFLFSRKIKYCIIKGKLNTDCRALWSDVVSASRQQLIRHLFVPPSLSSLMSSRLRNTLQNTSWCHLYCCVRGGRLFVCFCRWINQTSPDKNLHAPNCSQSSTTPIHAWWVTTGGVLCPEDARTSLDEEKNLHQKARYDNLIQSS